MSDKPTTYELLMQENDEGRSDLIRQVTELLKANDELLKANDELSARVSALNRSNDDLSQLATVISHDMKEPLRAITGFLELLEKDYGPRLDDGAREFIRTAAERANRMSRKITDLRKYASIAANKDPFEVIDCNKVIDGVVSDLRIPIEESKAIVTYQGLPNVMGYGTLIEALFQNLISNAIKYRQKNNAPEVVISAQRDGNYYRFEVKDKGIGIPEECYSRLFGLFQRFEPEKCEGTGMGLAICKRIVERHCGKIWAESEVGKGSTFYFTLLAAKD